MQNRANLERSRLHIKSFLWVWLPYSMVLFQFHIFQLNWSRWNTWREKRNNLPFCIHFSLWTNDEETKTVHFLVEVNRNYEQAIKSMLFYICFGRHSTFRFHCWVHRTKERKNEKRKRKDAMKWLSSTAMESDAMVSELTVFIGVFYIWIHTILSAMAICRCIQMPSL